MMRDQSRPDIHRDEAAVSALRGQRRDRLPVHGCARTGEQSVNMMRGQNCSDIHRNQAAVKTPYDQSHPDIHRNQAAADLPGTGAAPAVQCASGWYYSDESGWSYSDASESNVQRGNAMALAQTLSLTDIGEQTGDPAGDIDFSSTDGSVGETGRKRPLASFWDTVRRDVQDMPGDLWRDTKRVYTNPTNLVILGGTYGGMIALQQTGPDGTVEDHYNDRRHAFSDGWRDAFGALGNPGTHFALAGCWYLLGQQTQDDKTYEVGKTLFSALIINGLTTMIGQTATWDRAPNGEWGTFPSGHTSSSFCIASVLHEAYGHVVGVPLYGLASLVAVERLDDREHYLSDVVMGAVVGTVIGHSVASGRDPEFFGWKILPYANPEGGTGIAFYKSLDEPQPGRRR